MSWGDATVFVLQKITECRKWRHGELVEGDSDDVGNVLWKQRMFFESEECSSISLGYKWYHKMKRYWWEYSREQEG